MEIEICHSFRLTAFGFISPKQNLSTGKNKNKNIKRGNYTSSRDWSSILHGAVLSLGDMGKHSWPAVGPLSHLRCPLAHCPISVAFTCCKDQFRLTTDHLPVKTTCRVTSLCKVLSKFSGLTRNCFLTLKKILLINFKISIHFFLIISAFI